MIEWWQGALVAACALILLFSGYAWGYTDRSRKYK